MANTFSIKTLGCKLNQYDSALIAAGLIGRGWRARDFGEPADAVIINTCTVTDRSDRKCRNLIRQGARTAAAGGVIVTGCMAQSNPSSLLAMPEVLAVFGNDDKAHLAERIESLIAGVLPSGDQARAEELPLPYHHTRGYLKIQDGCDNSCSYCVIPSVRGRARSRPLEEILRHARALIDAGCPEIILTGITIGGYRSDGADLAAVMESLVMLGGSCRFRVTSIEPRDVTERLVDVMSDSRVCAHLHLPLQSGSDRILRLMNRPYAMGEYRDKVEMIRKGLPGIAIGTDIIVGFPSETEEDFAESLAAVSGFGYSYVHQFSFSPRAGTPASRMDGVVAPALVGERSLRLRVLAAEQALRYRREFEGRQLECVVEIDRRDGACTAVSSNYLKIRLENSEKTRRHAGGIAPVSLTHAGFPLSEGHIG